MSCRAVWRTFEVSTLCVFYVFVFIPLICPHSSALHIRINSKETFGDIPLLQWYLCDTGLRSNLVIDISAGTYTINGGPFCIIRNQKNITLRGEPGTEIRCSDEGRGMAFFNINNLKFENLVFSNCGMVVPSVFPGDGHVTVNNTYTYLGPMQRAVLLLLHCTNITLENVTIDKSHGFGVLAINPMQKTVARNVLIKSTNSLGPADSCNFTDMYCSGSGAVFLYADTDITHSRIEPGQTFSLDVVNCSFTNNTNTLPSSLLFKLVNTLVTAFQTQPILLSGGSGLAVYLGQLEYHVNVRIINSTVQYNTGNVSGMLLVHYNSLCNSKIQMDGVLVSHNSNTNEWGGGMSIIVTLFLDFLKHFPHYQPELHDLVEISRSTFSHNVASYGGATFLYMTPQNISDLRVIFRQTKFTKNISPSGASLNSDQYRSLSLINNRATFILLEDVQAFENYHPLSLFSKDSPENSAVFLISNSYNVTIVGTKGKGSFFYDNPVSVIRTSGTNVILSGTIVFENNRGFNGGALSLLDNSVLLINNGSSLNFTRNTALTRGGAIYSDTLVSTACAIQFLGQNRIGIKEQQLKYLNVSITFSDNSAGNAGNSIYGNPLYYCNFLSISAVAHVDLISIGSEKILYDHAFNFQNSVDNRRAEINSLPQQICVCQNTTFTTEQCGSSYVSLGHEIFPGKALNLLLNSVDASKTPVPSLLYSQPIHFTSGPRSTIQLQHDENIRQLSGQNTCQQSRFTLFAPENVTVHLKLVTTPGGQDTTIIINVTHCPPGLTLGNDKLHPRCVCSDFILNTLESSCNESQGTVARPEPYWVGTETVDGNRLVGFIPTCPINYCKEDVTEIDLTTADPLCVSGRTGILCGSCKEGLSVVFGSPECKKCSNASIAYIIIFILAGLILVSIMFLLDLTITTGTINGLLFYASIVNIDSNIFFRGTGQHFFLVFISLLNLELGFPLCFYDGMKENVKLLLQYAFPIYLFFIMFAINHLSHHTTTMRRILSKFDGNHVLVTIFYMIFSKLMLTVTYSITFAKYVSEDSSQDRSVWFYDGSSNADDPLVIITILVAVVVFVGLILPYILVNTFHKYIRKVTSSVKYIRKVTSSVWLNAHIDANTAPYKDQMRYWFGVRLILIAILYFIVSNGAINSQYLALIIQLSFMVGYAILQAFLQPFKQQSIAILDMSFIVNLILLTIGTLYIQRDGGMMEDQSGRMEDQSDLVAFSVCIAFITFVGILAYHIWKRLYAIQVVKMRTDPLLEKAKEHYQRAMDKMKNFYKRIVRRLKGDNSEDISLDVREINELMGMSDMAPQVPLYRNKHKSKSVSPVSSRRSPSPYPPSLFVSDVESDNELREPVLDFVDHPTSIQRNHSLPVGMQYLNAPNPAVVLALNTLALYRSTPRAEGSPSSRSSSPTTSYISIDDKESSPDDIALHNTCNIRHTS